MDLIYNKEMYKDYLIKVLGTNIDKEGQELIFTIQKFNEILFTYKIRISLEVIYDKRFFKGNKQKAINSIICWGKKQVKSIIDNKDYKSKTKYEKEFTTFSYDLHNLIECLNKK